MPVNTLAGPRHGRGTLPWRILALTLPPLLLYLLLGPAPEALVYQRDAIAGGEWWRLLTGHWVHSDLQHLLFDVTALALVSCLFEKRPWWQPLLLLLTTTCILDIWLWWQMPWLHSYCGLSGLLNALLAAGLLLQWRQRDDWRYPLVGLLALIKLVTEMQLGDALFTNTAWGAVPEAHAIGMLAGVLFVLPALLLNRL